MPPKKRCFFETFFRSPDDGKDEEVQKKVTLRPVVFAQRNRKFSSSSHASLFCVPVRAAYGTAGAIKYFDKFVSLVGNKFYAVPSASVPAA